MKKQIVILSAIGLFVICTAEISSQSGKAGYTGSPGETKCNNCHSSFPLNSGGGSVNVTSNLSNWQYVPGQTYTVNLTVARSGNPLFGMGLEALTSSNANAGTLVITNNSTQIKTKTVNGVIRNNVVHTTNGGAATNTKTFTFNWTAPSTNIGNVTMYFTGVAADNTGDENGDYVYSGSQIITPQTTGIESVSEESGISISPNPAYDCINLKYHLDKSEKVSVTLLSINGKIATTLLHESFRKGDSNEHFALDRNILSKGIYILTMNAGGKSYSRKIALQ